MVRAPKADLGTMAITKAKAAETAPFATPPAAPVAAPIMPVSGGPKSLTVKLEADLYAELRAHCFERERATGSRVTHQQVMVEALRALLDAESK